MEKRRKRPESDFEVRRKITFQDIEKIVENFEKHFKGNEPRLLLKAIYSIYREHSTKISDKNIDLGKKENRPEISRSDVIRRYRKQEPDKNLIDDYKSHKGIIRKKLKEMIVLYEDGKSLNPKCLMIKSTRKGGGEESNYFVSIQPPKEKQRTFPIPAYSAGLNSADLLRSNLEKWKGSNYLGQNALSKQDLITIESGLNPSSLDDESLSYLMVSAIFRHYNYGIWWNQCKNNLVVIWHMLNLLPQMYRRPFWRVAFILQCVDPGLLSETISRFPIGALDNDLVKKALAHIKNKTVNKFLLECIEEKSFLVEPFATELLREFHDFDCGKLKEKP